MNATIRYRNLGVRKKFLVVAQVINPVTDQVMFTTGEHAGYPEAATEATSWLFARIAKLNDERGRNPNAS